MTDNSSTSGPLPGYPGFAIIAEGAVVAWFSNAEAAGQWGSEHHFGKWLMFECVLPRVEPFTPEAIASARANASALLKKLQGTSMQEE